MDSGLWPSAMRVKSRGRLSQRDVQKPSVMPEGSVHASANSDSSQALIALEFTRENFAEVGIRSKAKVMPGMRVEPLLPGRVDGS